MFLKGMPPTLPTLLRTLNLSRISQDLASPYHSICGEGIRNSMQSERRRDVFEGWAFLVFGCVSFVGFLYAALISKLLPPSDNPIVSAIQNDRYYCVLVPLTLTVVIAAVYFHWLSMKLFKHA